MQTTFTIIDRIDLEFALCNHYSSNIDIDIENEEHRTYLEWLEDQKDDEILIMWKGALGIADEENVFITQSYDRKAIVIPIINYRCLLCGEIYDYLGTQAAGHACEKHGKFLAKFDWKPLESFVPRYLSRGEPKLKRGSSASGTRVGFVSTYREKRGVYQSAGYVRNSQGALTKGGKPVLFCPTPIDRTK